LCGHNKIPEAGYFVRKRDLFSPQFWWLDWVTTSDEGLCSHNGRLHHTVGVYARDQMERKEAREQGRVKLALL
jgi:hypothetical protein